MAIICSLSSSCCGPTPYSCKHLDLWDVKRKPPARANSPPTETFINYDESSSPNADDYITPLEAGLKPTFKKKSSCRHTGELYSNRPEFSIPS